MSGECPIGTILMFGGGKDRLPSDWLYCDGKVTSQTEYPDLFKTVGHSFGNIAAKPGFDPNTQFYLPDLRGRFVRGVDDATGRDPDVAARTDMQGEKIPSTGVGSLQDDQFRSHDHKFTRLGAEDPGHGEAGGNYWRFTDDMTAKSGGNETRPINAAVYFIIRAK